MATKTVVGNEDFEASLTEGKNKEYYLQTIKKHKQRVTKIAKEKTVKTMKLSPVNNNFYFTQSK